MNDQITGVIRAILAAAGGWAVGKGYIDSPTATAASGAILVLITAAWSVYSNTQSQKIQSINAADNGVKVVAATVQAPPVSTPLK